MINSLKIRNQIFSLALIGVAVFMVAFLFKTQLFIIISILGWLLIKGYRNLKFIHLNLSLISLVIFYFLHIFFIHYSEKEYLNEAFFDLEVKLSIFIFPIILLNANLTKKQFFNILRGFILTVCIVLLCSYIIAIYKSVIIINDNLVINLAAKEQWENYSFAQLITYRMSNFTYYFLIGRFHHPTYFSMYCAFSLAVLYCNGKYLFKNAWLRLSIFVFLIMSILLIASRAGVIVLLSLLTVIVLIEILKAKGYKSLVIFLIFLITLYVSFNYTRLALYRDFRFLKSVEDFEKIDVRASLWVNSIRLISKNWLLGVGTGNVKRELGEECVNNVEYYKSNPLINSHNQFLETWIAQGILGVIMLLFIFYIALRRGIIQRNWTLLLFLLIVFLNFLMESMLNTFAGVVFFAFFYSLLNSNNMNYLKTKN